MDSTDALSRSRCRERRLNKATPTVFIYAANFNMHDTFNVCCEFGNNSKH